MEQEVIKPTYKIAFKIWWAILWRSVIVSKFTFLGADRISLLLPDTGSKYFHSFLIIFIPTFCIFITFHIIKLVLQCYFKDFTFLIFVKNKAAGIKHEEIPVNATLEISFKFWWAILWRTIIVVVLSGLIICLPIDVYLSYTNTPVPKLLMHLIAYCAGFFSSIYVIKNILNKKFKTFSLYIVKNQADNTGSLKHFIIGRN